MVIPTRPWKRVPLRAIQVLYDEGYQAFAKKSVEVLHDLVAPPTYSRWIAKYDGVKRHVRRKIQTAVSGWPFKPLISVIMPVYTTEPRWLPVVIHSVQAQLYPNWELYISGDASAARGVQDMLLDFTRHDFRIRTFSCTSHGDISVNLNRALSLASGEFVAFINLDAVLAPHALYWVAKEIIEHPSIDLIFSDEDKIDHKGKWVSLRYFLNLFRQIHQSKLANALYRLVENTQIGTMPLYLNFFDNIIVYARKDSEFKQ